jgi:hypothetical protein
MPNISEHCRAEASEQDQRTLGGFPPLGGTPVVRLGRASGLNPAKI